MRVYLGSDHAGFAIKQYIAARQAERGHDVVDVGPANYDPDDDYPLYCLHVAARVAADPGSFGVVVGETGNGEQIAANKVPGCRAALPWNELAARLVRESNDANVVAIGARMHPAEVATEIVNVFLGTSYHDREPHIRRIAQIAEYETSRRLPPL